MNYVDALFVAGQYQIKPPVPFVPGTESAGVVSAVGEGVSDARGGPTRPGLGGLGGFATKVAAAAAVGHGDPRRPRRGAGGHVHPELQHVPLRPALASRGPAGESVLVLGAGGGVGLAAIGVARALGCRVLGVASTEEKRAAALGAGAEAAIDPAAEPVKDAARAWAGGDRRRRGDRPGGRRAGGAVAARPGRPGPLLRHRLRRRRHPSIPLNQVLLRNRTVVGIDWGIWAMQHADDQRALLGDLLEMVAGGHIDPVPPNEYPLDDVARALDDLLGGASSGRSR